MARFLSDLDKTYDAQVCFGRTSSTYDNEGLAPEQKPAEVPDLSEHQIVEMLKEYTALIRQQVPAYSAVRVNGERLYRMARRGEDVELPEREVNIREIEFRSFRKPVLSIRVTCPRGTYIRSLANDLGTRLGCGAYLSGLDRTAIGPMALQNALTLDEVEQLHHEGCLETHLLAYEQVLNFSSLTIRPECRDFVFSGRDITNRQIAGVQGCFACGEKIFIKDTQGTVLALGVASVTSDAVNKSDDATKLFNYIRVLN